MLASVSSKFGLSLLIALGCCLGSAVAQVPGPSEELKLLEKDNGEWKAEVKMFIPGTDQSIEGEGTEVNKWVAGGMWMHTHFKGDFQGQVFEGEGHVGYDPGQKKYVGTWVDSMTPALSVMSGTYDEKTHTLTTMMESTDAATGQKTTTKSTVKYIDDDNRLMMMWTKSADGDDEWVKSMEIKYTRKK